MPAWFAEAQTAACKQDGAVIEPAGLSGGLLLDAGGGGREGGATAAATGLHWRFPSARMHLWSRTASGPVAVLDLQAMELHLTVDAATQQLLLRLMRQPGAVGPVSLAGRLAASSAHRLCVELVAAAAAPGDVVVPVAIGDGPPGPPEALTHDLRAALAVAFSRQQPAGVAHLLEARAWCRPRDSGGLALGGVAVLPAAILDLKPLLAKCIVDTPLARALLQGLRPSPLAPPPLQDGFLSMDQGRSLVPLALDDPAARSVPLVGVWVAGAPDVRHPLVAGACLRFLCSQALADKALDVDCSFLLALYVPGASSAAWYECHVSLHGGAVPLAARKFSIQALGGGGDPLASAVAEAMCVQVPGCPAAVGRQRHGDASNLTRHEALASTMSNGDALLQLPPPAAPAPSPANDSAPAAAPALDSAGQTSLLSLAAWGGEEGVPEAGCAAKQRAPDGEQAAAPDLRAQPVVAAVDARRDQHVEEEEPQQGAPPPAPAVLAGSSTISSMLELQLEVQALRQQVQLLEQRVAALQLTPPAAAVPVLACATVPWGVLPWLTSVQPPAAQWQPIAGAASSVEPSACAGRVEEWQPPSSRGSSRCSQQWVAPVSLEAVPCPAAAEGDTLDRLLDDAERAASALSCHSSLPDAYQTPSDACTQQPAPARQARVAVVARARVPSPLLLLSWEGGAPADDSDEDERLEQKYGLVRRRGVQPDWMMVRVRRSRGAGGNRV